MDWTCVWLISFSLNGMYVEKDAILIDENADQCFWFNGLYLWWQVDDEFCALV